MTAEGLPGTVAPGDPGPPPGLVVVGRYDELPGYTVQRPHGADSWLFTWTVSGRGTLRQGRTETAAGAGELVVLAPGVPHRYGVQPGCDHWEFWWAHCGARPSWTAWLGPCDRGDGLYAVAPDPAGEDPRTRVEAAFRRMFADARRPGTGLPPGPVPAGDRATVAVAHGTIARELALNALEEVVLLAAGAVHRTRTGAAADGDPRVRRAQELIEADPGAPHTVRSLAAEVALSPSRFAHLFTRQQGHSPMRAVREARLQHAARLLESTDLSVGRVAAASGFSSPFHFNRVFRERYGTPPGAYRAAGSMVGA
ncbi:helix-turn-helix domain-containing protein [Streptomyces griseorubiginosus]|uniref:helix-turn-helix domain-containing protein n=1 Tax=Streptomyces griseorubiginosus TaxID=67304 RepID=UPI0036F02A29